MQGELVETGASSVEHGQRSRSALQGSDEACAPERDGASRGAAAAALARGVSMPTLGLLRTTTSGRNDLSIHSTFGFVSASPHPTYSILVHSYSGERRRIKTFSYSFLFRLRPRATDVHVQLSCPSNRILRLDIRYIRCRSLFLSRGTLKGTHQIPQVVLLRPCACPSARTCFALRRFFQKPK